MMLSKPPAVPLLLVPHSVENLVPITAEDHISLSKKVIFGLFIKGPFIEQYLGQKLTRDDIGY